MMTMRRWMPFTIVMLLLMQTVALNFVTPAQAASGRGGTNDDFTVKSISIGNTSAPADQWVQSDGSVVDYIFINEPVEVTISIQRFGSSAIQEDSPVQVDVVHPIGFVMESFTFNTNLLTGGQTYNHKLEWTPTAAHSILNTSTNDLSGGLILRATVSFDDDDRNENDQRDLVVPVAVNANTMEDFQAPGVGFISGKYPADGGDATAGGSWQTGATTSAAGSKHFRHSSPGSNYPSNAEATRLVYARTGGAGGQCETDALTPVSRKSTRHGCAECCFIPTNSFRANSTFKRGGPWLLVTVFPWNSGVARATSTTPMNPFLGTSVKATPAPLPVNGPTSRGTRKRHGCKYPTLRTRSLPRWQLLCL